MQQETFRIVVEASDQAEAGRGAQALADRLREADGVLEAVRRKTDPASMDLGPTVDLLANTGTAAASVVSIAHTVVIWLRSRAGTKVVIERDASTGNLRAEIERLDFDLATRVVEFVRKS